MDFGPNANPTLRSRLTLWSWGLGILLRHGKPQRAFSFFGGIGDELMATVVFRELHRRGIRRLWMLAWHPELFDNNPHCLMAIRDTAPVLNMLRRLAVPIESLRYEDHDESTDIGISPSQHLIAGMCSQAGISGSVGLRPEVFLSESEKAFGRFSPRQVVIQCSGLGALNPMRNKEWGVDRFQAVVDALRDQFDFIQVGTKAEPLLGNVCDMRGEFTLRQTAATLANSQLFVGQVGGLMHLARAVDCRAVIVYGGRESPWQSGYSCNENVVSAPLSCSPCWRWNKCDYERICLSSIAPDRVVEAIFRATAQSGKPLAVDSVEVGVAQDTAVPE